MNASPATDWAWSQVSSPNLHFTAQTALTFLGLARLADEALNSPNGYAFSTASEIERITGLDLAWVLESLGHLDVCGLVNHQKAAPGYRIPEEAFNRHLAGCGLCVGRPPAFEVSIRQEGTLHRVRACPSCASELVAEGKAVTLVPIEAVADTTPKEAAHAR